MRASKLSPRPSLGLCQKELAIADGHQMTRLGDQSLNVASLARRFPGLCIDAVEARIENARADLAAGQSGLRAVEHAQQGDEALPLKGRDAGSGGGWKSAHK